jgi:5-hydroxyisourate hydrolase-like protein (transthyretin family)
MPQPKSVKIAGTDIDEVQGVNVTINTPVGVRGDYAGRTAAATVQLYRRARNTPTSEMFKNATNEDGRLNIVNGTIVLENSKRKETYTVDMQQAYISGWQVMQPPDDDDFIEVITLQVGEMTLSGGGKSKSFKVPQFTNAV